MIYTGYFACTKLYLSRGMKTVSIAGKAPSFYNGPQFKGFAPDYRMYMDWKKGVIDDFEYTRQFTEKLNQLDKEAVKRFLTSFDTDIVLMCYEKPGSFCHRHVVADWIENNLHLRVEEYNKDRMNAIIDCTEALKTNCLTKAMMKEHFPALDVEKFISTLKEDNKSDYLLYYREIDGEIYFSLELKEDFLNHYDIK